MKQFLLTLLVMMVLGSVSFGQYAVTIQNVTASPNENVPVNVTVANFTGVLAFQLFVHYDPTIVTYLGYSNFTQSPAPTVAIINGNTVSFVWTFGSSACTVVNGTLFTLNFKYHGLTCPLSFTGLCEVDTGIPPNPVSVTYTNGSVSPYAGNTEQARIGNVFAATGSSVSVPLWYTGNAGTNVDTITQKIAYDPAKLTFVSVTGSGLLSTGITATASSGIITVSWAKGAGALINTPGTQFNLNFTYTGSTTTNVTFSTGCIIKAAPTGSNVAVSYNNGSVLHAGVATAFATLPALTTAVQGQNIDVPLTFSGMPSGITSFYLNLTYDNPRMSFAGVFSAVQSVTANSSGNAISLSYTNGSAPDINGQFLVLRFTYNGVGTAGINFSTACQFSNASPIQVGFTNGSVSSAHVPGTDATIGYVTAVSGNPAQVPVTFTGLPGNIGNVTMNIAFDAAKLTYVSLSNNPHNATAELKGNVVVVTWSSLTPTDINGAPFVTLQFNYTSGGSGNCGAAVTFADGSLIKSTSNAIIPLNWNDGGVNIKFTISGTLVYNNDPNPRIPLQGFTVSLKSGSNTIATATTQGGTGAFSLLAPNGNYTLVASAPVTATHYIDLDDAVAIFFYCAGDPFPSQDTINLTAGDVNMNGYIDLDDYVDAFFLVASMPIPDYTAPDWIFETPYINIQCAGATDKVIMGLCSGDVLGNNPDPNN